MYEKCINQYEKISSRKTKVVRGENEKQIHKRQAIIKTDIKTSKTNTFNRSPVLILIIVRVFTFYILIPSVKTSSLILLIRFSNLLANAFHFKSNPSDWTIKFTILSRAFRCIPDRRIRRDHMCGMRMPRSLSLRQANETRSATRVHSGDSIKIDQAVLGQGKEGREAERGTEKIVHTRSSYNLTL